MIRRFSSTRYIDRESVEEFLVDWSITKMTNRIAEILRNSMYFARDVPEANGTVIDGILYMAAILAGIVQTLLVAFSRRICCSRAMRVMNRYGVVGQNDEKD